LNNRDDDGDENDTKICSSRNNRDDVIPFHHRPHHESDSDGFSSQHQRRRNKRPYKESDVRVDISWIWKGKCNLMSSLIDSKPWRGFLFQRVSWRYKSEVGGFKIEKVCFPMVVES